MKLSKLLFIPLIGLFMGGCDMIDYHPYDVRISGQTDINNRNIEKIEANCKDKATIRFVIMGDSQRWYDETLDFVNHLNKRDDIDFVIHGGDYSDFGVTDEFLWQRDIMNKLKVPYVGLIGNHDCLGTGEETFRAVPGEPDFKDDPDRVKMETVEVFFEKRKAVNGAIMRVSGDSVARYRAATHAEQLYASHVLFDHDYDLADTTKMYCTELIDFVYRKEGIDLPEGRVSHVNIPGFRGDYLLPNDIAQSKRLCLIYYF